MAARVPRILSNLMTSYTPTLAKARCNVKPHGTIEDGFRVRETVGGAELLKSDG
jgi:hypothetical protein